MTSCAIMYNLIVHNDTFHQGMYCLLNKNDLQKKENMFFKIITCNSFSYSRKALGSGQLFHPLNTVFQ